MKTCVDTGKNAAESKGLAISKRRIYRTYLHCTQNLLYFVSDVIASVFTTFHYEKQEKSVEAYVQNWKKRSEMGLLV